MVTIPGYAPKATLSEDIDRKLDTNKTICRVCNIFRPSPRTQTEPGIKYHDPCICPVRRNNMYIF